MEAERPNGLNLTDKDILMDYTTITTAVDFAGAITGIGAVFAAVVLVKVALKGGRMLLAAVR